MGIPLALFFLACAARIFFSLARSALINMRRPRLLELEQRNVAARRIQRLTENSSRFLATAEVGALISLVFAAGLAAVYIAPPFSGWLSTLTTGWLTDQISEVIAFVALMFVTALFLFVFGRLVPEAIAVRYTEPLALALVEPMHVISILLTPLVRLAVIVSNALSIPFGGQKRESTSLVTEEEIKTMVDAGQEEGLIELDEKAMILSVLDFGETLAREVMVPRIDIIALDTDTPFDAALAAVVKAGHSRIPVYRESIDEIVGVLYAKDMLRALADHRIPQIGQLLRPVSFTPEAKRVNELLQDLQKSRVHMCIVVDEFGGTAGLVTIEDILEEIVGEIQDEYDTEEPDSVALPDGQGFVLDAGMNLDDVNDLLRTTLTTESSDTLGGYIYDHLGKVPDPGDTVIADGISLEVLSVKDRRILKIKALYVPKDSEDNNSNTDEDTERHSEDTQRHVHNNGTNGITPSTAA
jgi:CBS domain containing-hemolysin-like protein